MKTTRVYAIYFGVLWGLFFLFASPHARKEALTPFLLFLLAAGFVFTIWIKDKV
jgi:hypothetical protein